MIEIIVKLITASMLSAFVGLEREKQDKPAGLRTIMLVCIGATLTSIMTLELVSMSVSRGLTFDFSRIIAYTIASIGFLGSGVIIQHKGSIEGITTATLLWTMVSVGLFCGIGKFHIAIVATAFIYIILKLKHVRTKIEEKRNCTCERKKR